MTSIIEGLYDQSPGALQGRVSVRKGSLQMTIVINRTCVDPEVDILKFIWPSMLNQNELFIYVFFNKRPNF